MQITFLDLHKCQSTYALIYIPVDGQLNEGTWILIQICFVDQHGVGPLISYSPYTSDIRTNIYIYIYIFCCCFFWLF